MNPELLIRQIETYSNAIVAFVVLQGLAYAFAFGTDPFFNCLVKTTPHLAEGLALLFAAVMLLAVVATIALCRAVRRLSGEYGGMVVKLYIGKLVAVVLLGIVPLVLTVEYGVRDYPGKTACQAAAAQTP